MKVWNGHSEIWNHFMKYLHDPTENKILGLVVELFCLLQNHNVYAAVISPYRCSHNLRVSQLVLIQRIKAAAKHFSIHCEKHSFVHEGHISARNIANSTRHIGYCNMHMFVHLPHSLVRLLNILTN